MRILVRPTRAKAGRANVVGYAFAALHTSRSQVGVLLDASGQHARCTVREISTVPQPVMGVPRGRAAPKFPESVSLNPGDCLLGWLAVEVPVGMKVQKVVWRPGGETIAGRLP